jgi:hypothetical protein
MAWSANQRRIDRSDGIALLSKLSPGRFSREHPIQSAIRSFILFHAHNLYDRGEKIGIRLNQPFLAVECPWKVRSFAGICEAKGLEENVPMPAISFSED